MSNGAGAETVETGIASGVEDGRGWPVKYAMAGGICGIPVMRPMTRPAATDAEDVVFTDGMALMFSMTASACSPGLVGRLRRPLDATDCPVLAILIEDKRYVPTIQTRLIRVKYFRTDRFAPDLPTPNSRVDASVKNSDIADSRLAGTSWK